MTIHVQERTSPPTQIKEHLRRLLELNGQDPDLVNGIDTAVSIDDGISAQERHCRYMADMSNRREGNLHLEDGHYCAVCKNKGYIVKAEQSEFGYWQEVQYDCDCMTMLRAIRQMKRSGLQHMIHRYTLDAYHTNEPWQESVKAKAEQFIAEKQKDLQRNKQRDGSSVTHTSDSWFFIGGVSGSGKTHICTAICRELLLAGMEVRYMLWREDAVRLKALVNDYSAYEQKLNQFKHVKVLYIDDLFKTGTVGRANQQPTAADLNLAFELLNYRYNNPHLVTILSSQCTTDELMQIDDAIGGRIIERARGYTVNLAGEKNYRVR